MWQQGKAYLLHALSGAPFQTPNSPLPTLKTWDSKEHTYDTAVNFLPKSLCKTTNSLKVSSRTPRQKKRVQERLC